MNAGIVVPPHTCHFEQCSQGLSKVLSDFHRILTESFSRPNECSVPPGACLQIYYSSYPKVL
jgi:hypothetical protein